jgi:hypothetical protein
MPPRPDPLLRGAADEFNVRNKAGYYADTPVKSN